MPTKHTPIIPMVNFISVDNFKKSAKRLVEIMKKRNIDLKHSEALEMMSNVEGYKDYNTFVAIAKKNNEETNSQYASLSTLITNIQESFTNTENKVDLLGKMQPHTLNRYLNTEIDLLIKDLEDVLFFYEDKKGNYLEIRRASDDIVQFSENGRVEDFIIVTLRNEYLPIEKAKINILSKNHEILEFEDILKSILIEFKDVKLKTKVNHTKVPIKVSGKISKNFQFDEITVSNSIEFYNDNFSKNHKEMESFRKPKAETFYFGIKCCLNEYDTVSNHLIIKHGNKTVLDETIERIDIDNLDKKLEILQSITTYTTPNYLIAYGTDALKEAYSIKLDGEKLYDSANNENFIIDKKENNARTFIIKSIENYIQIPGLYNALLEVLKNSMLHNECDIPTTLSPDTIKKLLINGQAMKKEFEFNMEVECFDVNRIMGEV